MILHSYVNYRNWLLVLQSIIYQFILSKKSYYPYNFILSLESHMNMSWTIMNSRNSIPVSFKVPEMSFFQFMNAYTYPTDTVYVKFIPKIYITTIPDWNGMCLYVKGHLVRQNSKIVLRNGRACVGISHGTHFVSSYGNIMIQ